MPARKEKVITYNREENFKFDFPVWWNRANFFLKFDDRKVDTNHPLYVNYAYLLMPGEAISFNKDCKAQFASKQIDQPNQVRVDMEGIEAILKKSHWVIVESYEWESGM